MAQPNLAGREHLLSDIEAAFDAGSSDPNLCTIFVGARGTGKTALLSYLSREASARGWVAANVSAVPGMLEDIVERSSAASICPTSASFLTVDGNGFATVSRGFPPHRL